MEQTVLAELHDAKLKAVECIDKGDLELADKYLEVARSFEKCLKMMNEE